MKAIYRGLALLVPIIVAVQAMAIATEMFGLGSWVEDGNSFTKSALEGDSGSVTGAVGGQIHGFGAMALVLIGLVLLVVSFFAKIDGGVKWAAIVFGDVLLQWVFAFAGFIVSWQIGALHGLNALVLAGLGMKAYSLAKRSTAVTEAPVGAGV